MENKNTQNEGVRKIHAEDVIDSLHTLLKKDFVSNNNLPMDYSPFRKEKQQQYKESILQKSFIALGILMFGWFALNIVLSSQETKANAEDSYVIQTPTAQLRLDKWESYKKIRDCIEYANVAQANLNDIAHKKDIGKVVDLNSLPEKVSKNCGVLDNTVVLGF